LNPAAPANSEGPADFESWTTRYEHLRQEALAGGSSDGHWGLALFLRQGLVAWMRAGPLSPTPPRSTGYPWPPPDGNRPGLPSNLQAQLITVLVNMVVGPPQEVCA
jgi:hypothetical protein